MADNEVEEITVTAPAKGVRTRSRGVDLYKPQISVVLKKTRRRQSVSEGLATNDRVAAQSAEIDLTAYLAEGCTVFTERSTRGGAGSFSIELPDQSSPLDQDSIYGLVEPMDVIEIRACRDISTTDDQAGSSRTRLPIIMRGFVSDIRRGEAMTDRGMQRRVYITGHCYGKILQIIRIMYLPGMLPGQDLLTAFKLFLNYGVEAEADQEAGDFLQSVMDKVVKQFIGKLKEQASGAESPVLDFEVDSTVKDGIVSPFGTQSWDGGSIYDMLAYFGDVPIWNELFVEDGADAPRLVYRPTPFKTVGGDYIQEGANAQTVELIAADVISLTPSRSDANVANFYWVDAPRFNLVGAPVLRAQMQDGKLQPNPDQKDYANSDLKLFGVRMMMVETQQGARADGKAEASLDQADSDAVDMCNEKRRILIENNKDNVVFETGGMVLKGNEKVRPGVYLRLTRGRFQAEYYAHTVRQTWTFGGPFTTTVSFDRGTGFINRIQRSGAQSAYQDELTIGGAYVG